MRLRLLHGDCLDRMAEMPDGSVGAVVCDPPYNLTPTGSANPGRKYWAMFQDSGREDEVPEGNVRRKRREGVIPKGFMGMPWDGSEVALDPVFWGQILRVLEPGGVVKAFGATRTFHRILGAMEKAGLVGLHLDAWGYGSGFPKSHPVAVYMDRLLTEGRSREIQRHGVGNLNGRFADAGVGFESQSKAHTITTPEAQGWDGWGTALKPAWEPVVIGRKPVGTVLTPPPGAT